MIPTNANKFINIDNNFDDVAESVIHEYFTRLNNHEFIATAELFAEQGYLNPPFEKTIHGKEAIAQYLNKEAVGIKCDPEHGEILLSNHLFTQYKIQGKVKTSYFTVNVSWLIQLNAAKEIMFVDIKLLASLSDLLNLRDS